MVEFSGTGLAFDGSKKYQDQTINTNIKDAKKGTVKDFKKGAVEIPVKEKEPKEKQQEQQNTKTGSSETHFQFQNQLLWGVCH